jgi:putative ABC transport system permease protein
MTSAWLAWRTMRRYRARTALATAGVAIIGALLFDMLLLSRGLVISFADLLNHSGYDVRVLNSQGFSVSRVPIPNASEVSTAIERLPQVASVARIRLEPASAVHNGSEVNLTLVATTHSGAQVAWTLIKGADLPTEQTPGERCSILISQNLAEHLNLEPGATLPLRARVSGERSALPAVPCRIVGIGSSPFSSGVSDFEALTTMRGLQEMRGGSDDDIADVVMVASRPDSESSATVRAIAGKRPDLHVFSNADVVEQFNRNGFAYFRQISVVLSSITIVFTFLLVATILTVSTNQRLGEIAALRALGIGRQRIAAMLLWESVLIVGVGGVLALPLGGLVAIVLDRILKEMPGVPDALHFFVFEARAVELHAALLAATALIAALYPMWLTARLPIASTLRREVVG